MRLKNKFRPNLSDGGGRARPRRVSSSEDPSIAAVASKRARTVSSTWTQGQQERSPSSSTATQATKSQEAPLSPDATQLPRAPASVEKIERDAQVTEDENAVIELTPPPSFPLITCPVSSPSTTSRPRRLSTASYSSDDARGGSPSKRPRRFTCDKEAAVAVTAPGWVSATVPAQPASIFDRRKADHKRKFNNGVPERNKMTMFDLIYYNPMEGSRMSNSSSRRTSRASMSSEGATASVTGAALAPANDDAIVPDSVTNTMEQVRHRLEEEGGGERVEEEAVDEPSATRSNNEDEVDEEDKMPVPQVKVGPNGEMIIDEESTVIETTAARKAKEDLLKAPLVFENANQTSNYGSWGKKRKNVDWSSRETVRFYRALAVFGTDFSMMESIFKRRTRHELKMKFKKEEKQNRPLVDKCLREGMQFDTSIFASESEEEEEDNDKAEKKGRTAGEKKKQGEQKTRKHKPKKKRVRKVRSTRGYYSSSEDADESEVASEEENSEVAAGGDAGDNPVIRDTIREDLCQIERAVNDKLDQPSRQSRRRRQAAPNLSMTQRKNTEVEDDDASAQSEVSTSASPVCKSLLTVSNSSPSKQPQARFPPGLLAANPDLANVVPGSYVVVSSSKNDHQQKMLHVYFRVKGGENEKSKEVEEQEQTSSKSPDEAKTS